RLREPNRDLLHTLGKVTEDVRKATHGAQEPRFYGPPPGEPVYLLQTKQASGAPETAQTEAFTSAPEREPLVPNQGGQVPTASSKNAAHLESARDLWIKIVIVASIILGLAFAGLVALPFISFKPTPEPGVPRTNVPSQSSIPPPPPAVPSRPVNGTWDVTMTCGDGSDVKEFGARFAGGLYARSFTTPAGVHGVTQLAMGYGGSENDLQLRGYVIFNGTDVYRVSAEASLSQGQFVGQGSYGAMSNCKFSASSK